MNYKVLYRKYRPTDFENVVGQDYIVKTLKNSIISNNISHAYIFSGPRGTGKTSTAKIFAKAINCLNPKDGEPCGKCEFCQNYENHPDIIEMDAASNNGVDEIREIIENIKLTPTSAKYKVYIIDEVHMLTTNAFNALLLTLEEPPKHVVFIFATTNIESVPITILSRCQRYDFQKITVDTMVNRLANICSIEKIKIDDDAIEEIAYLAEGGMRDALSLLDQLSKNVEKITVDLIESQIRIFSKKGVSKIIDCLENNNIDEFVNDIANYKKQNVDYKSFLKRMINAFSIRAKEIKQTGKITSLNYSDYKNLVFDLTECFNKININVDPFTIIELVILEYFKPSCSKAGIEKVKPTPIKADNNSKTLQDGNIDIRINNCFAGAKKQFLEEVKGKIKTLCNSLGSSVVKTILTDSQPVAASDKYIIFSTDNEVAASKANKSTKKIEAQIKNSEVGEYKVIFVSNSNWEKLKEEYINNIKNGVKYELIEENEDTKEIINDIFDSSKVEII